MNNENRTIDSDYLDRLAEILPFERTLTTLERFLIVVIVSTFVSFVGCLLLCLICPKSTIRKRYDAKRQNRNVFEKSSTRNSILLVPPPPSYDSIVQIVRKSSNENISETDGISTNGLSLATISNTFPLAPFANFNVKIEFETNRNELNVFLTNGQQIFPHPAFDEQSEFFVRLQLINTKIFKKFQEASKKRRASLTLTIWTKQQEKQTKSENFLRTKTDSTISDEKIRFDLNKNEISTFSLRFLLCCSDRSGLKDVMVESSISLTNSMFPSHEQIIEFKEMPQIIFAEIFLGLGYLPTAERLTLTITKLRHFFKFDKENKFDVRLIVTGFHHGRRFFQKKISCTFDNSPSNELQINENLTHIVPIQDVPSVYVHLNFIGKNDQTIFPPMSILIGRHTNHESEWSKLIEQPRQTHFGWFPFLS